MVEVESFEQKIVENLLTLYITFEKKMYSPKNIDNFSVVWVVELVTYSLPEAI